MECVVCVQPFTSKITKIQVNYTKRIHIWKLVETNERYEKKQINLIQNIHIEHDNKEDDVDYEFSETIDIIEEGKIDRHFTREATTKLFKKVKTCEFKRNSVFIFARTNYSFHGVEEVNINKSERNLLLVNFYGEKNNE